MIWMVPLIVGTFFTWGGWSFFVAVGTIGLACATGWLAWNTHSAVDVSREQINLATRELAAVEIQANAISAQTQALRDQVAATERQVAISSASLESASRPVLAGVVPAPAFRTRTQRVDAEWETVDYWKGHDVHVVRDQVHFEETDDMVYCSVPLRNLGAGVAFLQEATLVTRTDYPGRVSNPIVAPGETTRARFAVVLRQMDKRATDVNEVTKTGRGYVQFKIRVAYTGASRELVTVSEITAAQVPTGEFFFTEQAIWDGTGEDRKLLVSTENIG